MYPINTILVVKVEPIKVPVESANCNSANASILLPALDFKKCIWNLWVPNGIND
jgi:hypothetical protein